MYEVTPNQYQPSSRLKALVYGTSKSLGASCNVHRVKDSVEGITSAYTWAMQVLSNQGAPSMDFSDVRQKGSKVSSGGVSSGAVSFMRPYDSIVHVMRRPEKKNGAGAVGLDWSHPELVDFIREPFDSLFKMVYIPQNLTYGADRFLANDKLLQLLTAAFNANKIFLVKRPFPTRDMKPRMLNLCTEVELEDLDVCVLGAVNLADVGELFEDFPSVFPVSAELLAKCNQDAARPSILMSNLVHCDNVARQIGLGVLGLSSALGRFNISYQQFNEALAHILLDKPKRYKGCPRAYAAATNIVTGYRRATEILKPYNLTAAFCIQPTVSTSRRVVDSEGYNVSPEIQPPIGMHTGESVVTIVKSAIKGDEVVNYHPLTYTTDDVPYEVYAYTSGLWQILMNDTRLAHRHSHCFYGKEFTVDNLRALYNTPVINEIKSMYYRLPYQQNTEALRKDTLWQDATGVTEFTLEDIIGTGKCQQVTDDGCEACSM
jgi:Ribonucleotide reductase, barrel domain